MGALIQVAQSRLFQQPALGFSSSGRQRKIQSASLTVPATSYANGAIPITVAGLVPGDAVLWHSIQLILQQAAPAPLNVIEAYLAIQFNAGAGIISVPIGVPIQTTNELWQENVIGFQLLQALVTFEDLQALGKYVPGLSFNLVTAITLYNPNAVAASVSVTTALLYHYLHGEREG